MIGERVNDHDGIFARLDNFVEIANRAMAYRQSQRTIVPDGLLAFNQESSDQVGRGEIFVTGDGDQRALKSPGHVLDKAGLATAGWAFQDHRQMRGVCGQVYIFAGILYNDDALKS